jgi:hypothetical protein
MEYDLPLLSIEAAEEIQKKVKGVKTDFKSTKELSYLLKENFSNRLDCSVIFSNAYRSAYENEMSGSLNQNSKNYMEKISEKLNNLDSLKEEELEKLVKFCTDLSDFAQLHKDELESLRGPCF